MSSNCFFSFMVNSILALGPRSHGWWIASLVRFVTFKYFVLASFIVVWSLFWHVLLIFSPLTSLSVVFFKSAYTLFALSEKKLCYKQKNFDLKIFRNLLQSQSTNEDITQTWQPGLHHLPPTSSHLPLPMETSGTHAGTGRRPNGL